MKRYFIMGVVLIVATAIMVFSHRWMSAATEAMQVSQTASGTTARPSEQRAAEQPARMARIDSGSKSGGGIQIDELSDLRNRASSGDSSAASELAADSNHCHALEMTLSVLNAHLGQDLSQLSAEQMQQYDAGLQMIEERLGKYKEFCQRNGRQLIANRLDNLLRAAEFGDSAARQCSVDATFDLTGSNLSADNVAHFQQRARDFLQDGVIHGSWVAVRQLYDAYSAASYFRQDLKSTLFTPSAKDAFRYGRLLQLGGALATSDPPTSSAALDELSASLSPDDVASADEWAKSTFLNRFASSPPYAGGIVCN